MKCHNNSYIQRWVGVEYSPPTEVRVMNSNNYHFEVRSLVQDSGSKDNKWTKERLCGGE